MFGTKLQLPVTHPAVLAGLLLQPCAQRPLLQQGTQTCPLGQLHVQLLHLVSCSSVKMLQPACGCLHHRQRLCITHHIVLLKSCSAWHTPEHASSLRLVHTYTLSFVSDLLSLLLPSLNFFVVTSHFNHFHFNQGRHSTLPLNQGCVVVSMHKSAGAKRARGEGQGHAEELAAGAVPLVSKQASRIHTASTSFRLRDCTHTAVC